MEMRNRESNSPLSGLYLTDNLAAQWQDVLLLIGRVLIGWIFVMSGWGKLWNIPGFAATMEGRGLPEFLGYLAPLVEFFGGCFLLLGIVTRYTTLLLILFMFIATFSSHRYWIFTEPAQRTIQNSNFWKNVSMTGGIIVLFVSGAGRYAVDRLLRKG